MLTLCTLGKKKVSAMTALALNDTISFDMVGVSAGYTVNAKISQIIPDRRTIICSGAASMYILNTVERTVVKYHPAGISDFKLNNLRVNSGSIGYNADKGYIYSYEKAQEEYIPIKAGDKVRSIGKTWEVLVVAKDNVAFLQRVEDAYFGSTSKITSRVLDPKDASAVATFSGVKVVNL